MELAEWAPLLVSLASGIITALLAGRIAQSGAAVQRRFEQDQWLLEQRREAYTSLLAAVEGAYYGKRFQGPSLDLREARARVRLVGSVAARKAAAALAEELAISAAIGETYAGARDEAFRNVQNAIVGFIAAAREDLGAATPDDETLGTVEIVGFSPEVRTLSQEYLDRDFGGGEEE